MDEHGINVYNVINVKKGGIAVSGTKNVYVVVSQSGTMPSRVLRKITGAPYNHVSVSLRADLKQMYSFGRRYKYYPFWGGFVQESPTSGTFSRFPNTKAKILSVEVSDEQYEGIGGTINRMFQKRQKYHYDYLGVGLAYFKIRHQSEYSYYCSAFVKDLLQLHGVKAVESLPKVVLPIHFLDMPGAKLVYDGRLRDYTI